MRGMRMLARARRLAESRMSETVVVGRFVDGTDPVTNAATRVIAEKRYEGPARVRYPSYAVAALSPKSQPVAQQDVVVSLPTGSGPVFEGDEVVVVSSVSDAGIVGRRFTVKGQPLAGQTSAYRVPTIENT